MSLQDLPDSVIRRRYWSPLTLQIEEMAVKDPNSKVRASALSFLQFFFLYDKGAKAMYIYNNALKDSSYNVVAAAIHGLFINTPREDSTSLTNKLAPFETLTRSHEVMLALSNVYARYGGPEKAWFFRKLRGYGNQFFDDYRHFLVRMDCDVIARQEPFILGLDKYAKNGWDMSAYQGFLHDMAKNLNSRTEHSEMDHCKRLADEFLDKASNLKVKF